MAEIDIGPDLGADDVRLELAFFLGESVRDSSGDLDEFRDKAMQLLFVSSKHAEALFVLAFTARIRGADQEFQAIWDIFYQNFPQKDRALGLLASAFWRAEKYHLVTEYARPWLALSPTEPTPYVIGAVSSKLTGDSEGFAGFIEDACKNLTSPIHVPTGALQGDDVTQQRARIKAAVSAPERAPVFESDGLTFARQYFLDVEWRNFNPKGRTVDVIEDVGAIEPPGDRIPALRLTAPFSQDLNHKRGIGFINTLCAWDVSEFIDDYSLQPGLANTPANRIDVSRGEIRLRMRPVSLDTKDFQLTLFCQTLVDISDDGTHSIAAWVLTGNRIDCGKLEDGKWQIITFRIESDPSSWQIALDNPEVNQLKWPYVDAPLEQALILNETTFALTFTGGAWPDIPEGAMELHYIELGINHHQR